MRSDGRKHDELRPVKITPGYVIYPEGSVLFEMGNTRVLCNVSIEEGVPRWMVNQGVTGGWITGEYSLLPRSTLTRTPRENNGLGGRTHEIRRLIGRSLRAAVDLQKLGQHTIILDCDVLQADGGTRTAAITGGYIALAIAIQKLENEGRLSPGCLQSPVAAVSVGIVEGASLLDLCYNEDKIAQVDANVVMNARGEFIEVQGTAEGDPFPRARFDDLLDLAQKGIGDLLGVQRQILKG